MIYITWIFLTKLFQIEVNAKCFHFSHTAFIYEQKSQPNTTLIFELFLFLMQKENTFRAYMIWRRKIKNSSQYALFCMFDSRCYDSMHSSISTYYGGLFMDIICGGRGGIAFGFVLFLHFALAVCVYVPIKSDYLESGFHFFNPGICCHYPTNMLTQLSKKLNNFFTSLHNYRPCTI